MNSHPVPAPDDGGLAQAPRSSWSAAPRMPRNARRRSCNAAAGGLQTSHGVAVFLGTTTAVSAAFWVIGQASDARILVPGLPVSALMFIAPLVGAIAACPRAEWAAALGRVRSRSRRDTAAAILTAAAWAPLMPAVVFVSYLVGEGSARDIGRLDLDWRLGAVALAVFLVTAIAEELGWTWFLTRRLSRLGIWQAALLIGAIWAALHIIPWAQAGRDWVWIAAQSAFSIAFRLMLVAGFRLTSRMGVVIAMHASYNTAWVLLEDSGAGYSPGLTTLILLPLAVLVWLRARRARDGAPSSAAARGLRST